MSDRERGRRPRPAGRRDERREGLLSERRTDDRGQTMIDFGIGAGIFLLAVAAVFILSPGMLDPFTTDQDQVGVADRTASQLTTSMLVADGEPYVLDADCTDRFFDTSLASGSCPFSPGGADLPATFNVDAAFNVSIEQAGGGVVDTTTGAAMVAGPTPPDGGRSVVVSQRAVVYRGRTYRLFVRVW